MTIYIYYITIYIYILWFFDLESPNAHFLKLSDDCQFHLHPMLIGFIPMSAGYNTG